MLSGLQHSLADLWSLSALLLDRPRSLYYLLNTSKAYAGFKGTYHALVILERGKGGQQC